MMYENLSQSILTKLQDKLTKEEWLWIVGLPEELDGKIGEMEAKMLVRLDEKDWPEKLKDVVRDYIELDE